jgi:hypothetical protein
LLTVFNTGTVQRTTNGVITNTRQVLNTTATDQNNRVLLQVVTFTTDVGGDFKSRWSDEHGILYAVQS